MDIREELKKRNLPDILLMNNGDIVTEKNWTQRKEELLEILSENLFGYTPAPPKRVDTTEETANRHKIFGGKAKTEIRRIVFDTPKGDYSFPIEITIPKKRPNPPDSRDMSLSKLRELVMDREALACCSSWGHKELDTTERLN